MLLYKVIIFDFDGTILDTTKIKAEGFFKLYLGYGQKQALKVKEYHLQHEGTPRNDKFKFFEEKILGNKFSNHKSIELSKKYFEIIKSDLSSAKLIPGALKFFNKNYLSYDLYIASSAPQTEIIELCKLFKIDFYFKGIYGHPVKKENIVNRIISENNYCKSNIVFIGDTNSDLYLAEKNKIDFIGIGKNFEKIFNKNKLIKNFFDLDKMFFHE